MMQFEKQNEIADMKQDMMDDVFDDPEEDEEGTKQEKDSQHKHKEKLIKCWRALDWKSMNRFIFPSVSI